MESPGSISSASTSSYAAETPLCNHLSLPPPHDPRFDGYQPYYHLRRCEYDAVELLNWTERQWRDHEFLEHCKEAKQEIMDTLGPMLPFHRTQDDKSWKWDGSVTSHQVMHRLFTLFDTCFFFGTLSNYYGTRTTSLVTLKIMCENARPGDKPGTFILGWCKHSFRNAGNGRPMAANCRIEIWTHEGTGSPRKLHQMVATLVHEMVHSYLANFLCHRDACRSRADYRTLYGVEGHGTAFLLLQARITSIVRGLAPSLGTYMISDSRESPLPLVSVTSLEFEAKKWDECRSQDRNWEQKPFSLAPRADFPGFRAEHDHIEDLISLFEKLPSPEPTKRKRTATPEPETPPPSPKRARISPTVLSTYLSDSVPLWWFPESTRLGWLFKRRYRRRGSTRSGMRLMTRRRTNPSTR